MTRDLALEASCIVVEKIRQAGYQADWVGVCVRDRLLGMNPRDYDIATNARPDIIQTLFADTDNAGAKYGVIGVWIRLRNQRFSYEVATYRLDGEYLDGRHPDKVTFTESKHQDLARRDFTINAMMMDPWTHELFDPYHGMSDIQARLIRCVGHPERVAQDPSRMLRAVRFAVTLEFEIEPSTLAVICQNANQICHSVNNMLLASELHLIFAHNLVRAYHILTATNLWYALFAYHNC